VAVGACTATRPADDKPISALTPIALGVIVGAIDPCALLGAGEPEPQSEGRWACQLGEFRAVITDFGHRQRYAAEPIEISGAKAYPAVLPCWPSR
jgi:hypothetical protein